VADDRERLIKRLEAAARDGRTDPSDSEFNEYLIDVESAIAGWRRAHPGHRERVKLGRPSAAPGRAKVLRDLRAAEPGPCRKEFVNHFVSLDVDRALARRWYIEADRDLSVHDRESKSEDFSPPK
jgi:hypothetical protein